MSEKRLVSNFLPSGAFDPLQNFETVTYTGNGGTQKITGYIRKGAAFNGLSANGSVIHISNDAFFRQKQTLSVSLWFKTNASASQSLRLFTDYNSASYNIFSEINSSGNIVVINRFNNATNTFTSTGTYDNSQWHHLVITNNVSSLTQTIYVDGSSIGTNNMSSNGWSTGTTGKVGIGASWSTSNTRWQNSFNGSIDQVRIFDKALSSSEVTTLYNETYDSSTKSTTDIFGDSSGVALYELDEDANSSNFGQAASFNGSSSNIQNSSLPTVFSSANTISVSAWINTSHTGSGGEVIWSFSDNTAASTELACQVRNSKIQCFNRINGSHSAGPNFFTSITVADGNWHHIAYVASSSGTKFYIDGVEDTNRSFQDSTDANDVVAFTNMNVFSFGGNDDSKSGLESLYSGKIDQVRIYSSALDSDDVAELYAESADVPTANLVAHYKLDGNANDETDTYDGTASNVTYSTGVYGGTPTNVNFLGMAFQPDLVYIKCRTDTFAPVLFDTVRGTTKALWSSENYAQQNDSDTITSFDSNGFTTGDDAKTNRSSEDFVAWCWKAGGTAVSNTDGSITSSVSANTAAGFSIVKYTGTGASATVGHGLSSAPELIITKGLGTNYNWNVSTSLLPNGYLELNTTSSFNSNSSRYITAGNTTNSLTDYVQFNQNNIDHIAYCFHSVDGYQKVGSYTGTGSSGNSVTTGFQPRFVLIKRTDTSGSGWGVFDSVRGGNLMLRANVSDAEADGNNSVSFVSNGFTLPETGVTTNTSGGTYIYLAIA